MADLRFISSNPVLDSFNQQQEISRARQAEERRLAAEEASFQQQQALDEALRGGLAETYGGGDALGAVTADGMGGPDTAAQPGLMGPRDSDPLMARLIATPGGGELAFQRHQQMQDEADEFEKLAITALGKGDMEVYNFYASKAGLQLPPEIVQNAEARSLLARGTLLAGDFYKKNEAQAQRFLQAFLQSGGDVQAAFNAAGAPSAAPGRGRAPTLQTVMKGDQRVLALISPDTGRVQYITDDSGQNVVSGTGTGRTGQGFKPSAFREKFQMYRHAYPDATEAEILEMIEGDSGSAPDMTKLRRDAYELVSKQMDGMRPKYQTEEERIQATNDLVEFWLGANDTDHAPELNGSTEMEGDFLVGGQGTNMVQPPADEPDAVFTGAYHEGLPVFERPDGSRFAYDEAS